MSSALFTNEKSSRSLSEFEFLHNPNDKNSKLGVGSFASVKLAKEKKTGKQHAIKIISMHPDKVTASDLHNIKTEISIHRKIDHPNIIKFYDYIHKEHYVYLVLDYAESGNLYSYIHKRKSLATEEIFRFFHQSALAIQYLHQNDILHRDIKPENLLLDRHRNIKLCDFGWSTRRITEKRLTFCGTYEYMAPEIVHKKPYDYRVDIWSLGVLLYELIHREAPYKGRSLSEITKSLAKGHITFSPNAHPEAKDLILKILKANPSDRLSVNQILAHPWVQLHLKPKENDSLQVEDCRVSPRDVSRQENSKNVYSENPKVQLKRDHHNFKSEILMSTDNVLSVETTASQTRTNSNAHLYSSFSGSLVSKDKEREGLRDKTREKERLRENQPFATSESHVDCSASQRKSPIYEFNRAQALRLVDENVPVVRIHAKSSSTISNNILEKLSTDDKMSTHSIYRKRVLEGSALSPNFKSKVDTIFQQLSSHTTSHKSSEHTSIFNSRHANRPYLQQPSQNPSSESPLVSRYYNESAQPNQSQQNQTVRTKALSKFDGSIVPPVSTFASTFRTKSDVENFKENGFFQQTAKNSYHSKISLPKQEGQPSLYSSVSTTNRSTRSKMSSRESELSNNEKNFAHKFSHTDVSKSLNFKSFGSVLSVADQNKYKISEIHQVSSTQNKYSKVLDYKRKHSSRVSEDMGPINLHISSLSERRNENKENKRDHLKDKENYMRMREEYNRNVVF